MCHMFAHCSCFCYWCWKFSTFLLSGSKNRAHSKNVWKSAEYLFISPHWINNQHVLVWDSSHTWGGEERLFVAVRQLGIGSKLLFCAVPKMSSVYGQWFHPCMHCVFIYFLILLTFFIDHDSLFCCTFTCFLKEIVARWAYTPVRAIQIQTGSCTTCAWIHSTLINIWAKKKEHTKDIMLKNNTIIMFW